MQNPNAKDIIVCDGVKKWFGDFQALKGVTTTVKEQEVVVVIGPSGSGKSTLIRCINRLEAHQEGSIVVYGIELTNDLRNIEKKSAELVNDPTVMVGTLVGRRYEIVGDYELRKSAD